MVLANHASFQRSHISNTISSTEQISPPLVPAVNDRRPDQLWQFSRYRDIFGPSEIDMFQTFPVTNFSTTNAGGQRTGP